MGDIILIANSLPDLLPQKSRSEGIHVSQIIQDICIQRGWYDEQTSIPRSRWELGKALERSLISAFEREFPGRYIEPGELSYDGLLGTPDILDVPEEEVDDIKLTERSSGDTPKLYTPAPLDHPIHSDRFWANWTQIMAYCTMIGWSKGALLLTHQRGDYRERRREVIYHAWQQVFTRYELDERWLMLKRHADKYHCKRCGQTERIGGCYHCPECLRDIMEEDHSKGCQYEGQYPWT